MNHANHAYLPLLKDNAKIDVNDFTYENEEGSHSLRSLYQKGEVAILEILTSNLRHQNIVWVTVSNAQHRPHKGTHSNRSSKFQFRLIPLFQTMSKPFYKEEPKGRRPGIAYHLKRFSFFLRWGLGQVHSAPITPPLSRVVPRMRTWLVSFGSFRVQYVII